MHEQEIVRRIKGGDAEALAILLDRYGDGVFSTVMRVVGSREEAEEVTQDVFMKVFDKIGGYRGESALSTWIYRIAYNQAISSIRRLRRNRTVACDDILSRYPGAEEDAGNEQELLEALEKSLERLPADESLLVTMFYHQDKSIAELAEITSLSEANVKVKLHRIRKKLYICISENGCNG